jgi:hypothetical protein
VVLPCAFQLRVLLFVPLGRFELLIEPLFGRTELLYVLLVPVRPGCVADGGRFAESCDARLALMPVLLLGME